MFEKHKTETKELFMEHYSIGEVSDRLGISRDALRFYEKKGIINPKKEKNGYRAYTYDDIHKLSSILFYRRLNFSLEDIDRILYHSSLPSYSSIIQEKIAKEKQEVEKHKQSLVHLAHLKQLSKNVELCLNQYDIRPLRRHYIIPDNGFIYAKGISDLCYRFQEYRINDDSTEKGKEYSVMACHTAAVMDFYEEVENFPILQHNRCVYTIIASHQTTPDPVAISEAADWAKEQGYSLTGTAYSCHLPGYTFLYRPNGKSEEPVYYIELFLPLHNA
jgi:DNA-binding transcriptional MerR regulator